MIAIVYNNVGSAGKIEGFVEIVLGFMPDALIVISHPYGSGAQTGVPAASKKIFKTGGKLLVTSSLKEAIDLLKPSKVYVLEPRDRGASEEFDPEEIIKEMDKESVMLVFGGESPGTPLKEQELAHKVVWVGSPENIGAQAALAIVLYEIKKRRNL